MFSINEYQLLSRINDKFQDIVSEVRVTVEIQNYDNIWIHCKYPNNLKDSIKTDGSRLNMQLIIILECQDIIGILQYFSEWGDDYNE